MVGNMKCYVKQLCIGYIVRCMENGHNIFDGVFEVTIEMQNGEHVLGWQICPENGPIGMEPLLKEKPLNILPILG